MFAPFRQWYADFDTTVACRKWRYYLQMRKLTLAILLLASVSALADDSDLVALAKRTHRATSKTPVITNDTLAASKGRISISSGTASTPAATPAVMPAVSTSTPAAKPVAQQASVAVAPNRVSAPIDNVTVPAAVASTEPQSSSVHYTPAESTARIMTPESSARDIQPQSTARNIQPESTVRNTDISTPKQ